jgi:acetyl-CoA acetyltransferase
LKDAAAVVGIGETPFAKRLEGSEKKLALQAILAALEDAGIEPDQVDGFASYTMETTDEVEIAKCLGAGDVTFFGQVGYGGGAGPACVGQLAIAIAAGQCRVGVVWRSRKRGSGARPWANVVQQLPTPAAWTRPFGLLRPADEIAILTRAMHGSERTEHLERRIAVRMAQRNPRQ